MGEGKTGDDSGEAEGLLRGSEDEVEEENALIIRSQECLSRAKAVKLSPTDILKLLSSGIRAFISAVEALERQSNPE